MVDLLLFAFEGKVELLNPLGDCTHCLVLPIYYAVPGEVTSLGEAEATSSHGLSRFVSPAWDTPRRLT
jgi:hypothetical protein